MKIQLPLENWTDLLSLVPRRQLVEIIKQIGDRQFASILQFFLTKEGQITLGHLRIVAPRENAPNGGGPIVEMRKEMPPFRSEWITRPPSDLETNLPEVPMPANVKDFKLIELSYFDPSVANFLRQFQHEQQPGNSLLLLENVNLWFSSSLSPYDDNTLIRILAQLMPMIGSINSMSLCHLHHMEFGRSGRGPSNAAFQLLTTMLTNARILEIYDDLQICVFSWCDWLYTPRNDGKPRALRLADSFTNTQNLIEQIKKDFSKATRPASLFVYFRAIRRRRGNLLWQEQGICMDNGQTNERLVVKTFASPPGEKHVLVARYPVGANQEWIKANEQEIMECKFYEQNRRIHFERNLRNGLKSFPSPDLFYYIKTQSGSQDGQFRYLCVLDKQHSSAGDRPPSKFKFIKNSDGSILISTMEGYLQINMESSRLCLAGVNSCSADKFMLIFRQQSQQPGFVVDIRSLSNDCFLSVDHQQNRILANSRTPPANKFLIIPANEQ